LVGQDLFTVGRYFHGEDGCLRVDLFEGIGALADIPVGPAVEVFDDADFGWGGFVIADFDFKAFVDPARLIVELVIHAVAPAG
jgi:hypothetical protein